MPKKLALYGHQAWKALVTDTGISFETAVARAFGELGLSVAKRARNRADLIVTGGPRTAVLEAKGLSKSAGEGDAAQLEK